MEDRKFADIGETVRQQYCSYSPWADLVTVHPLPGDGVLKALSTAFTESTSQPRAVFIVAQLSCQNNLITADYTKGDYYNNYFIHFVTLYSL
ncbi:orotidine 5'-phosphate decarboxylase-like [Nilaparvata lugens]|uniref:orotidine 5'-phosphate decarboxylase-like n=1 Tax=Nilaparvata lugens TaxID=108931 RepID=UPI00193D8CC7|nr:orotidine 5'-phosphate decarboxylase-like [Nilaparvata lugens]